MILLQKALEADETTSKFELNEFSSKTTSSCEVGTHSPPGPPLVRDQLALSYHSPVPPTQKSTLGSGLVAFRTFSFSPPSIESLKSIPNPLEVSNLIRLKLNPSGWKLLIVKNKSAKSG